MAVGVRRRLATPGAAAAVDGVTYVDLYRDYPRFDIDVNVEQKRLLDHDVILFQFPLFWYSTPSIIKEWEDLVLEHGFAYGTDGDKLEGKRLMLAITAAGPDDAYTSGGYQHYPLRDFLRPLEQTARLCKMEFSPPYVIYSSLRAPEDGRLGDHEHGPAGFDRRRECTRFCDVDERDVDSHPPQGHVELGVGAPVERLGGDDVVALAEDRRDRAERRRHARRRDRGAGTVLEAGQRLADRRPLPQRRLVLRRLQGNAGLRLVLRLDHRARRTARGIATPRGPSATGPAP